MKATFVTMAMAAAMLTGCSTFGNQVEKPAIIQQAEKTNNPLAYMHQAYTLAQHEINRQEQSIEYLQERLNYSFQVRDSLKQANQQLTNQNTEVTYALRRTEQDLEQQIIETRQMVQAWSGQKDQVRQQRTISGNWQRQTRQARGELQEAQNIQYQLREDLRACMINLARSSVATDVLMYHNGEKLIQFPGYDRACDRAANKCVNLEDLF